MLPKCEHCNKKGHKINKYWIKNPELKPNKNGVKTNQDLSFKITMIINDGFISDSLDIAKNKAYLNYLNCSKNNLFILDTGSIAYISYNKPLFTNLKPYNK